MTWLLFYGLLVWIGLRSDVMRKRSKSLARKFNQCLRCLAFCSYRTYLLLLQCLIPSHSITVGIECQKYVQIENHKCDSLCIASFTHHRNRNTRNKVEACRKKNKGYKMRQHFFCNTLNNLFDGCHRKHSEAKLHFCLLHHLCLPYDVQHRFARVLAIYRFYRLVSQSTPNFLTYTATHKL